MAKISDAKVIEIKHAIERLKEVNQNLFNLNYYLNVAMKGKAKISEEPEVQELINTLKRQKEICEAIIEGVVSKTEL